MGATIESGGEETVVLSESDGYIVAKDTETGITSQGETKAEALENLADALELYFTDSPDTNEKPESSTAPWF